MADIVSSEVRSRMMSAVRGKNTKPEMVVRRGLHALGFRYTLHSGKLQGRPDIVLKKYRAAIWVHGCFWHGHSCPAGKMPATRTEFWEAKIGRNRERDAEALAATSAAGWRTLTIWDCSLKARGAESVISQAAEWLRSGNPSVEI